MFLLAILFIGSLLWLLAHAVVKSLFFTKRFYLAGSIVALFFLLGYFISILELVSNVLFGLFMALLLFDIFFVFVAGKKPGAKRLITDRLSNGDINNVSITVKNNNPF